MSHSLGARVVLEAVKNLGRKARSVCVTAAAVDDNCLSKEYAAAFANADVISVLASRKDHVLSSPIRSAIRSPTFSACTKSVPLRTGRHGPPEPIGATVPPWQIPDTDNYDHGDYMPPSDTATTFPDPNGKWVKTSGFMRQAFEAVPATWPP